MSEETSASAFLAKATDPERPVIAGRVVLAFAHPDDETLACGGLLPRLKSATIIHVTDGAPPDGEDARRHGYAGVAEYRAARGREVQAAVALAGLGPDRLASLDVPDQGAVFALADVARRLVPILAGADVVVTHAYEGGHPDHDAVCWSVHAACGMLARQGRAPAIVEVPLYRLGPEAAWLRQGFADGPPQRLLSLTRAERELKVRMIAAHASQAETLSGFGAADEPYRAAPAYDFGEPPNDGAILYDHYGWGISAVRWLALAAEAGREFGRERAA